MPKRRKRRGGPIFGLCLLLVIASDGFFPPTPKAIAQVGAPAQPHRAAYASINKGSSFLGAIWTWASANRESIDPLAAIVGLVVASIVAAATFALWRATRDLAESTEDLAQGAREQSVEMRKAHALGERNLELSQKQFLLAGRTADITAQLHGLQREQFIAEHRPRLQIRSIAIDRPAAGALFQAGMAIKGSFVIVNIGGSEAKVREAEYKLFRAYSLPMVPPLDGKNQMFGGELPLTMKSHESRKIAFETAGLLGPEANDIVGGGGAYYLWLMGAVRFSDWNLMDRWMGFCRVYRPGKRTGEDGRFVPVDNSDYEYED